MATKLKLKRVHLGNLASSTPQEVFDWITINLIKQNHMSGIPFDISLYKDDKGRKCAGGWLFRCKDYKKKYEEVIWTKLVYEGFVPSAHEDLIRDLQVIHDNVSPRKWPKAFRDIAEDLGLNVNFKEEVPK